MLQRWLPSICTYVSNSCMPGVLHVLIRVPRARTGRRRRRSTDDWRAPHVVVIHVSLLVLTDLTHRGTRVLLVALL